MDRGAWWAPVHGVPKSQTQLSDYHSLSHSAGRRLRLLETQSLETSQESPPWLDPGQGGSLLHPGHPRPGPTGSSPALGDLRAGVPSAPLAGMTCSQRADASLGGQAHMADLWSGRGGTGAGRRRLALGFWGHPRRGERDTAESHWDDADGSKTLGARPWEQLGQRS